MDPPAAPIKPSHDPSPLPPFPATEPKRELFPEGAGYRVILVVPSGPPLQTELIHYEQATAMLQEATENARREGLSVKGAVVNGLHDRYVPQQGPDWVRVKAL